MRRQSKWKIKQFQAGNCINCGCPRCPEKPDCSGKLDSPYKRHCLKCAIKHRLRDQERERDREPWEAGKPGKPPLRKLDGLKIAIVKKTLIRNRINKEAVVMENNVKTVVKTEDLNLS